MYKPPLTETQKAIFSERFEEIIYSGSAKTIKLWNGKIQWDRDMPVFNDSVHLHLKGKSADEYEKLIQQLNSRTLS